MSNSSFSSLIEKFFQRNGGWLRIKGELAVYYWPRIAGPEIAQRVEAVRYLNGFLFLQTENPSLAHQITMLSSDIIKRYQKVLGTGVVKSIKIKIGTITENLSPVTESNSQEQELSGEENFLIRQCSETIRDPEIAAKFSKFMKKGIQVKKSKLVKGGSNCLSCGVIVEKEFNYCPCCERKIKEEIREYLAYLRKNNKEVPENFDWINNYSLFKETFNK